MTKQPNAVRRFSSYLKPYRWYLLAAFGAGLLGGFSSVYTTYEIGQSVNYIKGFNQVNFSAVYHIMIQLIILYLINIVSIYIITLLANQIGYFSVRDLRNETFALINKLPIRFFDTHAHGDLLSRFTNDLDFVSDALIALITTLFSGITVVLISLVVMLILNVSLALIVLAATVLMFLVTMAIAQGSQRFFRGQQTKVGDLSGYLTEYINQDKLVLAFGQEKSALAGFDEINDALNKIGQKAQFVSALANPSTRFVDHLSYISIGFVGGLLMLQPHSGVTVGMISSFIIYASQFTKPFLDLSGVTTQLQTAGAGLTRIFAIQDTPPETDDRDRQVLQAAPTEIAFDHVSFAYEPDEPLIEDFNLKIKAGETTAIVGQTGAGKSTMINLLMRYYHVGGGQITANQVNISDYTRQSYRHQFAIVLQDTWLFKGTIRENLKFARPDLSDEALAEIAKAANIDQFIARLPQGYDTPLLSGSFELSNGQRQLLTIARAMTVEAPILILDEATSNLDTLTEQKVQSAIDILMRGKTSFIIAHRLSTIQNATQIIVMGHGHILEVGNHKTLLAKKGAYYELYMAQFKDAENKKERLASEH